MQKLNTIYLGTLVSMFFLIGGSLIGQHDHQHDDHHHEHVHHHYAKVKVNFSTAEDEQFLQDLGISSCDIESIDHEQITFTIDKIQLKKLEESNLNYDVVIKDVGKYFGDLYRKYKSKNKTAKKTNKVANGFGPGSLANYYTYDEIVKKLDDLTRQYGDIASQKINIGTTIEGNIIWAIKISDNPNTDENEPVAYYDALHHANEYNSMATLVNFMIWILENYDTDPRVKYIIDHRELYFVPVVNVDAYKTNEQVFVNTGNPNGKRKNNRTGNGIADGVDLNRNYSQGYNIITGCSSPNDPNSGIYSGTHAFSEPETRAIRDFTAQINPQVALSCHTVRDAYLMPYGYSNTENDFPDFKNYSNWGSDFLSGIDSYYGNTFTQLAYVSCGTTRSYLHSTGTYAWTPELGLHISPSLQEIYDNADIHIEPFLYQAYIAGGYADIKSHEVTTNIVPGQSFDLSVTIQNKGIGQAAGPISLELVSTNPYFSRPPFVSYGSISVGSQTTRSVTANLGQGFTGDQFDVTMIVYQDGERVSSETIIVSVGQKTELFSDNAEGGSSNWTFNGNGIKWAKTTLDAYSGNTSYCDSPGRFDKYFYESETNNRFTSPAVNLSNTQNPVVSFASKWSLMEGAKVDFQVSPNGGSTWTTIDTYTGNQKWKFHRYQISAQYRASYFKARFTLVTPSNTYRADGFYFDDFNVFDYDTSTDPVCATANLYNVTDFESGNMGIWNDGGNYGRIYRYSGFAPNGEWSFYIAGSGEEATLFSDIIPANSQDVNIEFNYKSLNGGTGNKFYLEKKVNNGTWSIIKTFESLVDYNRGEVENWQTTISGGSTNNLELRFRADMVSGDYIFIDDIKIELCGGNNCIDQDQDGVCAAGDPDDNDPCVPNSCGGLTCQNTITFICQYSESFDNGFGQWVQSNDDDLDWKLKIGETPTSGTGPSEAHNGRFYIYVEASGNNIGYPQKTAIIESPCMDLSGGVTGLRYYTHMNGTQMGSLYLDVRTDGTQWQTVKTISGDQADSWKYQQYLFPSSLLGQTVQFRFRGVTGNGWSSDIAIDRICKL